MKTAKWPLTCALASTLLAASCATSPTSGAIGALTEAARCDAWRMSLPSRDEGDTPQTQAEIGAAYDVFMAACPGMTLPF